MWHRHSTCYRGTCSASGQCSTSAGCQGGTCDVPLADARFAAKRALPRAPAPAAALALAPASAPAHAADPAAAAAWAAFRADFLSDDMVIYLIELGALDADENIIKTVALPADARKVLPRAIAAKLVDFGVFFAL